jgi:uncharacterized membrane protein YgcG
MGILANIFGNNDHATKVIDGASKGLDKIFFTKEEKADANSKLAEWYLKYLSATQPQNLARRVIAFLIVGLWVLLVLFGVAIRWWNIAYSDYVFKVLTEVVMNPFMMIMGFYFLAHMVRTYKSDQQK